MDKEDAAISERVKRLGKFSWAKFSDHLEKHGGFNTCEACGKNEWTGSIDDDGKPVMLKTEMWSKPTEAYLFIPVTCGACGNTRLFNVGMMANHLEDEADA